MYKRKTVDEYDIFSNYGQGWELTTGCTDRKNAKELLKEYRENQPEYPHKIIKSRVKINPDNPPTRMQRYKRKLKENPAFYNCSQRGGHI